MLKLQFCLLFIVFCLMDVWGFWCWFGHPRFERRLSCSSGVTQWALQRNMACFWLTMTLAFMQVGLLLKTATETATRAYGWMMLHCWPTLI